LQEKKSACKATPKLSLHTPVPVEPVMLAAGVDAGRPEERVAAADAAEVEAKCVPSPAPACQEPAEEEVSPAAEEEEALAAVVPSGKGVANSPPLKPAAVKGGATVAMTVCIRRAGCTCADCAEMSGTAFSRAFIIKGASIEVNEALVRPARALTAQRCQG
jgi:hypothetical protein